MRVRTKKLDNSRAGYRDKLCNLSVWLAARSADADQSEASTKKGSILIGLEIECCVSQSVTSANTRTSSQLVNKIILCTIVHYEQLVTVTGSAISLSIIVPKVSAI